MTSHERSLSRKGLRLRLALGGILGAGLVALGVAAVLSTTTGPGCSAHQPRRASCTSALHRDHRAIDRRAPSGRHSAGGSPAAALPRCSAMVSSMDALGSSVASAAAGSVICIAPGSYTGLSLSGAHSSDVVVEPEPSLDPRGGPGHDRAELDGDQRHWGAVAGAIAPGSSHIVLRNLYFTSELSIGAGSSFITVADDDFTQIGDGKGMMIDFITSDCTVPNAPTWPSCTPLAPVSDVTIAGNRFHGIVRTGTDVLHTNNFRDLRVTGNEISGAVEDGNHVDCLQNVFGGSGLVFDHNYEHDNECQGIFLRTMGTSPTSASTTTCSCETTCRPSTGARATVQPDPQHGRRHRRAQHDLGR